MNSRRRIAFVDNKLENFHANVFLKAIRDPLADRGFTATGCTSLDSSTGQAWASKNSVPYFDSVEAIAAHADCFMILAPSNPEIHLDLCNRVFPAGKITYVDKTFAPDLATAKQIFALADQHKVPIQTTSALRYTAVQKRVAELGKQNVKHMTAWGGGDSFEEYAIHPVELVVSCMGSGVRELMRRGTGAQSQLLLNFSDERSATIHVNTGDTPFAATITTERTTEYVPVDPGPLFVDMARAILDFFDAGKPNIDRAESLAVRAILDAAIRPEAMNSFVTL